MAEYAVFYLGGRMVYATHGHHWNPENPPMLKAGDILLNGHTHVPKYEKAADFYYMNPGSVSIPKEASAHGYMVYSQEEDKYVWKDLGGSVYMEAKISQ